MWFVGAVSPDGRIWVTNNSDWRTLVFNNEKEIMEDEVLNGENIAGLSSSGEATPYFGVLKAQCRLMGAKKVLEKHGIDIFDLSANSKEGVFDEVPEEILILRAAMAELGVPNEVIEHSVRSNGSSLADTQIIRNNIKFSDFTDMRKFYFLSPEITRFMGLYANITDKAELTTVSALDTSKANSLSGMFMDCVRLRHLDVSNLKTTGVWAFTSMFKGCLSLEELDLSDWDWSSARNCMDMFADCKSLKSIKFPKAGFGDNLEQVDKMFRNCEKLEELDLSMMHTESVKNFAQMFSGCRNLKTLDISSFVNGVGVMTNEKNIFDGCQSLEHLRISSKGTDFGKLAVLAGVSKSCIEVVYK